ncbi:MAG: phenylalanine--tRNA ligase subunit alpha, partial [Deltaproteobacteria bacterium]|nr:phenylalanine--tRNA ligase subunit alpha [Deltaproteobacteria bacterium]
MRDAIQALKETFLQSLKNAADQQTLEEMRVAYLGKKGQVTALLKNVGAMSEEMKKTIGREINELKREITDQLAQRLETLREEALQKELDATPLFDVSMPPAM